MARVKIEDLKPEARNLNEKEMKKLFGGAIIINENTLTTRTLSTSIIQMQGPDTYPALTINFGKI
jgi:hypothetical protein